MSKWLIVLSLALPAVAWAATVWTWVDENGVRHFTDRPVEGAEQIEVGEAQSFSAPETPALARSSRTEEPEASATGYERLAITDPEQTETLWNIEGTLEVSFEVDPSLRAGHVVDLYLDGERQFLDARGSPIAVEEVYRGVHALEAVVLDGSGRELIRSPTRNFVVQQTSLLNPNNPNTSPPGSN